MSVAPRPRRSVLYMPGSNARALEKARSLPVDALILDLEDAVAPDAKELARAQVAEAVQAGGFGPREVLVRVNSLDGPLGPADMAAIAPVGADGILVPKVSSGQDVVTAAQAMSDAGAPDVTRLWVMIETPAAVLDPRGIAQAAANPANRLEGFVLGTNDLAKDTRARIVPGRAPMLPWIMTSLAAARLYDLAVIDGVYTDLEDIEGLEAECRQSLDCGLDGKTLIHPKQIEIANRVFAPSDDDLQHARHVIAAFDLPENADKGALRVDGKMVERLHAEMARRTVAIAEAIAARNID